MKRQKNRIESSFHTRARVLQRYGMSMTKDEYEIACHLYLGGHFTLVDEEPSNNQVIFDIPFHEIKIRCVWCTEREYITTCIERPVCPTCKGQRSVPSGAPVKGSYDDGVRKYCPTCLGTGEPVKGDE